jgi:hypothetical protein
MEGDQHLPPWKWILIPAIREMRDEDYEDFDPLWSEHENALEVDRLMNLPPMRGHRTKDRASLTESSRPYSP